MQILHEAGKTFLYGMMSKADVVNRNNRIYPEQTLLKATNNLIESVGKGKLYSELEHPPYLEVSYNDNVCGVITEVTWDSDAKATFCKVEILEDTESGKKVMSAIKDGTHIGISTRGSGTLTVNESKVGVVQDDLKFATADIILDGLQSCQTCVMQLHEKYETFYFDDFLVEAEKSCGCMLEKLTDDDKQVLQKELVEKITNIFK